MNAPELDAATEHAYRANVRRFYLYRFLISFHLWLPIWVLYLQRERGLSLAQVTALEGPFWLVMVLAEVPTGALADRWGRRLSMLLGAVTNALAIFLFGITTSFWLLLPVYLVWAVAITLDSGADTAFLYDTLAAMGRADEFRRAAGRAQACTVVATLAASLVGAPLAAATSLTVPILAGSGITLLAALVVWTLHEPQRHERGSHVPYFAVIGQAARYTLQHPPLRAMMVVHAVVWGAGMTGIIFVQPFLDHFEVPVGVFGLLETPGRLAAVAGSLAAHRLAVRFGERNVLCGLAAGCTGALLVLAAVPSVAAVAMFAVLTFCSVTLRPIVSDYVNRHAPQQLRATVASIGQMIASIVLAVAAPLLGRIADRSSLQVMFFAAGAGAGLLGAGALLAWGLAARAERRAAAADLTPS